MVIEHKVVMCSRIKLQSGTVGAVNTPCTTGRCSLSKVEVDIQEGGEGNGQVLNMLEHHSKHIAKLHGQQSVHMSINACYF